MSLSNSLIKSQQNLNEANSKNNCVYEFEDFRLDAAHLMLYQNSRTISLKPKVVETLVALVERRGEVISNEELMDRLWVDSFVEESNLTQNIYLLRKALGNCANGKPFIENFSRRGYRFNGETKPPVETQLLLATHTRTQTIIDETFESSPVRTRGRWALLAVAAAVLLGAVAYGVKNTGTNTFSSEVKNSAAVPFQTFRFKRRSDRGDVTSATISSDGNFIAYTDKSNAVWLKNTATESNVKVLPESETVESSAIAISPDNDYIYISHSSKDRKAELLKVALFGGAVQQKIVGDFWSGLSLSPDGKQLSFVRGDNETGEDALMIANTDGTGERKVAGSKKGTWFGMWSQSTAWSPDGNEIACIGGMFSDGKEITVIRLFRVVDGEEISLIKTEVEGHRIDSIAWLPDGNNLLVISNDQSSQGQIYEHTISTGEWRRVTNDLSNYVKMSVTADGKTVITIQEDNTGNLWLLPAEDDRSQAKQITFGRNLLTDVTGVSWTPDAQIVYSTNASGRWEIWRIDADGSNQKQLTRDCAGNDSCGQAVVSPDGHYIVFQATLGGVRNIWRMDEDGSNSRRLTDDGGSYPSVSPDGRFVIYTSQTSPTLLRQISIEGGTPEEFSKISTALAASLSPDGKKVAFHYYDKAARQPWQTCVAPVGADAPERCFTFSRSFPRWTADGKSFYYLDHNYVGIWKQPLDGERTLFLEFPGERTDNFAFSNDGKSLVVARSKPTQDIVAITDEN